MPLFASSFTIVTMFKAFLVLLSLTFTLCSYAGVIKLKDGKVIEAKIVERVQGYITVDFYGTPLTYYIEDIESIDGKTVHAFLAEPEESLLSLKENKAQSSQNNTGILKVDKTLLSEVFKIVEADKESDALTYYGAGLFCLGLLSYKHTIEAYNQGQVVFLYPRLDSELLEEFRSKLIYNAKKAMRKSVSLKPTECKFILGLALSNLIGLDSLNLGETSIAFDRLISLNKEDGLAYHLKALLHLNLNNSSGAWKSIQEAQGRSIVIDEYSMYTAIFDILNTQDHDETSSVILASVMVKGIRNYILLNITQPVTYLSKEKFESKSLFGKRSRDALEFARVEMISGMRVTSIKPQSFLSEAFGYSVEISAYEKLETLYKEQKAFSKLTQVEQTINARKISAEERQFLFQRIVAALKVIPNPTAEKNFFVSSFKEGEGASARKYLGLE